jgi:Pyruvate/2-oxoglutarate dehydrogenase complex, dihydrolipoamide acyltransferase (E2) component, and related enzymes
MPFLIKAVSLALSEFPIMNSWYNKDKPFEYTQVDNHNISFAIDSPKGLIVPNVKNCQDKSILEIHEEVTRIIKDAQAGVIGPKDLMDGTFSISNIGIEKDLYF